jgi:hypothetical protein
MRAGEEERARLLLPETPGTKRRRRRKRGPRGDGAGEALAVDGQALPAGSA